MGIFAEAIHLSLLLGSDLNHALSSPWFADHACSQLHKPHTTSHGSTRRPQARPAGYLSLFHLLPSGSTVQLIPPSLILRDEASSYQKFLTIPSPLVRLKSCPEEQEVAAGCARAGFGLRIPASKTNLLTEIPAQAVTQAQDPCLSPRDAKGA